MAGQAVRFGGNLILTRLLFPEAFGLMALIEAILMAIVMVTDIGLTQSVVRSKRGADPQFLNMIWTIQIVKGLVVALVLVVAAPFVAQAYSQPVLAQMLPVMGLVPIISGFSSTKIALANRKVEAGRLTAIELGTQALSLGSTIVLAFAWKSPWALLWGNVLGTVIKVLAGHLLLRGPKNRWHWDSSALGEIFSFGGWVTLSSILTYLAGEGRQLLMASLVDARIIGLLALAAGLNRVLWNAMQQLNSKVFFAAYSEIWRDRPERLRETLGKSRNAQLAAGAAMSSIYVLFGPQIVDFFYDDRYTAAGVFLQIQAVGFMLSVMVGSYSGVLWAIGRPGLSCVLIGLQVVFMFLAMSVGAHIAGALGLAVGIATISLGIYPVAAATYARLGLWYPKVDAVVIAAGIAAASFVYHFGAWRTIPI